jgi:putative ABC transport system substrate-binding protein
MKRRDFITLLGSAAAWPFAARAQQQVAVPKVGILHPGSAADTETYLVGFINGLRETGYFEGRNVILEYAWAHGQYDRLPALSRDLVARNVALIAAGGPPATVAARAVTRAIPIVFLTGDDPVQSGMVESFRRPGGNLTGVTVFAATPMWGKRLELLRDLLPRATSIALLGDPQDLPGLGMNELAPAAEALGLRLSFTVADSDDAIAAAFSTAAERGIEALLVSDRPFFTVRRARIVELAKKYAVPAVYGWHEYVLAGGLMSYGNSLTDAWHQVGIYAGQILKGASPADLPVVQPTKFELSINLKTARALGIEVPPSLLARADEVIE